MVATSTSAVYGRVFERERVRQDLHALEDRIVRQRDALLTLTTQDIECAALPGALSRIIAVTSSTLAVRRVSIWRYNASHTAIDCLDLFDAATGLHTSGETLQAASFPNYFRSLAEHDIVAVDDAITDPRTSEFAAVYLKPLSIVSMMDVPIHRNGRVIGVLCHEHTGTPRAWSSDEKAFGVAVSNLIALAFERCDRQRVEATSRLQEAALAAAADAIMISGRDGTALWVNPAFTALTGYSASDTIGRNPRELLKSGRHDASFYDRMWSTLLNGEVWRGEMINRRKDGSTYVEDQSITPVMAGGEISHFIAIKRDVTQRHALEAQFLQAQKMEVVGRLAGGIAHDFNNLLTVINGTSELALTDLPANHPLRADFHCIQEAGHRAASLTRQLLTFSRKQVVTRAPLSIGEVLTGFKSMLQRLIGEDIRLTVQAACNGGNVLADQGQLEQVILNLAVNARDAMPRGGELVIDAASVDLDDAVATVAGLEAGPYIRIDVRDTGEGMSPDVQARIFEPFFTTKETGKGTGLGLATVYAIVEQSGGTIHVASAVGSGTTFTMFLPRIEASAIAKVAAPDCRAVPVAETVLLVEDDIAVRQVTATILRSAGYRILTAADADEALLVLTAHRQLIGLIVTDVVLPGCGGRQLAAQAAAVAPDIPVLFTSGHADDIVLAHGIKQSHVHFIAKPYTPNALCSKVSEVLRAARIEVAA